MDSKDTEQEKPEEGQKTFRQRINEIIGFLDALMNEQRQAEEKKFKEASKRRKDQFMREAYEKGRDLANTTTENNFGSFIINEPMVLAQGWELYAIHSGRGTCGLQFPLNISPIEHIEHVEYIFRNYDKHARNQISKIENDHSGRTSTTEMNSMVGMISRAHEETKDVLLSHLIGFVDTLLKKMSIEDWYLAFLSFFLRVLQRRDDRYYKLLSYGDARCDWKNRAINAFLEQARKFIDTYQNTPDRNRIRAILVKMSKGEEDI